MKSFKGILNRNPTISTASLESECSNGSNVFAVLLKNTCKKKSFRQYCEANEEYHRRHTKNPTKNCSCYQAMLDFESEFPEIAKKYYDLRFDELNPYMKVK